MANQNVSPEEFKSCKMCNLCIHIYSQIHTKTDTHDVGDDDGDNNHVYDDDDGEDGQLLGDDQKEISFPLARRVTLILISLLIAQWGFFGKRKLFLFQSVFSVTGK